jgi:hypothetical protein
MLEKVISMFDKKISALNPPAYEAKHISAIQAVACGEASPDQQKLAMEWIINDAAGTYQQSYRPTEEGRRDTDFAEGRRFVGMQIVKLLKLNVAVFSNKKKIMEKNNG